MENTKTAEELKQFESSFNNAARLYKNTNDAARYLYENDITPLKKRIEELEANADEIERRYRIILSEPPGHVRETMIYSLLS